MAKVRVGIIGCGVMGQLHLSKLPEIKEAKLVGVYDIDDGKRKQTAEQFRVPAYPTLEELFSNIEAVIIASPTSTHYEIAKQAISKRKHALIEKPLAESSSLGEELKELAEKNKLVLAIGMIERFNPAFTKALSVVKHEKILGVDMKRFSPYPERITDANVVWDMMIHDIDLSLALVNSKLETIKAVGKKIKSDKLDETEAKLYFADGTIVNISCSRAKNNKQRAVTITTDRAIYEADLLLKKLYKKKFESLAEKEEIDLPKTDQIILEQKDFLSAIINVRAPRCNADRAVFALKIVEEIEKQCLSR